MALVEHLEKLRYFKRLVEFKSITDAASAIGITQAGLSKSITSLESALETKLFVRSSAGLILTAEGEMTLQCADKIIKDASELETRLRRLRYPLSPKTFRIGMYDSIAVYFYSALSEHLKAIYPSVELLLTVAPSPELATLIEQKKIDLAVGVNLRSFSVRDAKASLLFEDYYDVFVTAKRRVSEISQVLLIHPGAKDIAGRTCETLLPTELKNIHSHQVYNFETLKQLTLQGEGYGVLPVRVAKPLVKSGQLQRVAKSKNQSVFGVHEIGFLANDAFQKKHVDFVKDIFQLGKKWSELSS